MPPRAEAARSQPAARSWEEKRDGSSDDDDDDDSDEAEPQLRSKAAASQSRPAPSLPSSPPSDDWAVVSDPRRLKRAHRREARQAEEAALLAEQAVNREKEFSSSLTPFQPYLRQQGRREMVSKARPKQLGVIEDWIVPPAKGEQEGKRKAKSRAEKEQSSAGGGGGGRGGWGSAEDVAASIASWIERQVGEEVMTVAAIGERVQAVTGQPWKSRLRPRYGPIVDFLRSRPELSVDGDRVTVRQRKQRQDGQSDSEAAEAAGSRGEVGDPMTRRQRLNHLRAVERSSRSGLSFAVFLCVLLGVAWAAFSLWSGRSIGDLVELVRQHMQSIEAEVRRASAASQR